MDDAGDRLNERACFKTQILGQDVYLRPGSLHVFGESAINMNAQLGEVIAQQFFAADAVETGAAAHIDVSSDPITFLQSLGVLPEFGDYTRKLMPGDHR